MTFSTLVKTELICRQTFYLIALNSKTINEIPLFGLSDTELSHQL